MIDECDLEEKEEYNAFIKEYGHRDDWDFNDPELHEREELLDYIKYCWNEKAARQWRDKILRQFVYSLPNIKKPDITTPCIHKF